MFNAAPHKNCAPFSLFTKESTWPHYFDFYFSRIEHVSLAFSPPRLFVLHRLFTQMVNANRWRQSVYEGLASCGLFPARLIDGAC
jgi:hypothetical protein